MVDETAFPTSEQRRVIDRVRGAHLVLAPAGSGKTQVMTARLENALQNAFSPDRMLCVTFTNRAAEELRARLASSKVAARSRPHLRTFHGLCAWLLRGFADELGIPRDFAIYDEQDSIEILGAILPRSGTKHAKSNPRDFHFRLSERKSSAPVAELSLARIPPLFERSAEGAADEAARVVAERYHRILADRAALDFSDLVYRARSLLELDIGAREWLENRFDWIQIDEVQDTHFSEYEVIRRLALRTRNLALFGDVDQTIYGWRGSDPDSILGRFRRDFQPIEEHQLSVNFRATRHLLRFADRFADSFERRRTRLVPDASVPEGEAPTIQVFPTSQDESKWIASRVSERIGKPNPPRIGILARTHARLAEIGAALEARGVPHVTVEEFEFFRRQEIKDALARLRLVLNPDDSGSLRRILLRPSVGVGPASFDRLQRSGPAAALRLTDLARERTHDHGDPFALLLGALAHGTIVVFDVETTGLSTTEDEIVEVACIRVERGESSAEFRRLVRPSRPVGDSERIHGYSDEVLKHDGEDAATVLRDLVEFLGDAHVVGHNVRFDLSILRAQCERLGIELPRLEFDDTLDIARRVLDAPRFDLESLAKHLDLAHAPAHRAMEDVRATLDLLHALAPKIRDTAAAREALVREHGSPFRRIATSLTRWREMARAVRPGIVLARVLEESGLAEFYRGDRRRAANLEEMVRCFTSLDVPHRPPLAALSEIVSYSSLARNVDHLRDDDTRIPIVTVHQAKGLEFEVVFVAGLAEGEFPSFFAIRDDRVEEERRLFYVAITRARRSLFLTGHEQNARGYRVERSRFLEG